MKRFSKITAAFIAVLLFNTLATPINAQSKINQDSIAQKMGWFEDAKLGIFIHSQQTSNLACIHESVKWLYGK
jgi:hypothetical protein